MSLITRCPACRTMFKVVPDQLRISEGWVRCGKCEEIFDASAHLQDPAAAATPTGDSPDTVPFDGALAAAMTAGVADHSPRIEPGFAAQADVDFELKEPPVASMVEAAVPSNLLPEVSAYGALTTGAGDSTPPASATEAPQGVPSAEPAAQAVELSFMRHANRSSRWHRPLVRAVLMVLCLLLLAGLGGQFLVQERDRIATIEPGLKPLLEDICLLLDCRVRPLRQIESIVIDSSAFSKTRADAYRLSLTVKNNAPIDLAMPSVELALTDMLDQPLLRRVFLPEELGLRSGVIPASAEIQSTLVLTIKTPGNGERFAGYRLLAFYP